MADSSKARIFVVDDDPDILSVLSLIFKTSGYGCSCFGDAERCLEELEKGGCDLLITDMKMPGKSGMELLAEAKRMIGGLPVIVITSYGDIPTSVKAIKAGAFDFLEKPLDEQKLLKVVESALQQSG